MQRRFDIRVCRGPVCAGEREADAVHARLAELLAAHGLGDAVELERQSCFGRCRIGPNVHVGERLPPELLRAAALPGAPMPRKLSAFYNHVSPDDADEIVASHLVAGRVVERLTQRIPGLPPPAPAPGVEPDVAPGAIPSGPTATAAAAAAPADRASPGCKDSEPSADVVPDPR